MKIDFLAPDLMNRDFKFEILIFKISVQPLPNVSVYVLIYAIKLYCRAGTHVSSFSHPLQTQILNLNFKKFVGILLNFFLNTFY